MTIGLFLLLVFDSVHLAGFWLWGLCFRSLPFNGLLILVCLCVCLLFMFWVLVFASC